MKQFWKNNHLTTLALALAALALVVGSDQLIAHLRPPLTSDQTWISPLSEYIREIADSATNDTEPTTDPEP